MVSDDLGGMGMVVSRDPADLVAYARDLFPRHHLAVRSGNVAAHSPEAVVWPRSAHEVAQLVRFAIERGVALVPFGAGSGVCAAILPTPHSIVVDLKRMAAVRELERERRTVTVEAGHMGLPLEESLEREGLTLGHFPSSILCSTVGGWIAARSAGQASGLYGKIEDMVVALECVTGRGDIVRLVHRPHGPSLVPAVIGSEGTLAIVTAAKLRLHRAPTLRGYAAWSMPSMSVGWDTMREMFQSGLRPAVLRLYDPFDSMLAQQSRSRRRGPESKASCLRSDEKRGPGRGVAALRSLLARPQLFNELLDSNIASRALGGALLVAIFDGQDDGDAVFSDVARARAIVEHAGGRYEGEGPARKWLLHRYSVSYRQSPLFAQGMFVDTMEVAATWSRIGALYDGVRVAIGKSAFVMAHLSHAYPDGCCIYFSFAGVAKPRSSAEWDAASEARYDEIWHAALGAALAAGGTLAHHHGVGRSKAPRLGEDLGSGLDVQRALKRAFDPHGVLNPGALLPPVTPNPFAPDIGVLRVACDPTPRRGSDP